MSHLEKTPVRGEIWLMKGLHNTRTNQTEQSENYLLVLSDKAFNLLGSALVCSIVVGQESPKDKYRGFIVPVNFHHKRQHGYVMANSPFLINFQEITSALVEKVDPDVVDDVLARLSAILE